jgi:hypothetical protein
LIIHLFVGCNDGAGNFLCDSAEVGVRLELHVTLVARLVVDDLHLTLKILRKYWFNVNCIKVNEEKSPLERPVLS